MKKTFTLWVALLPFLLFAQVPKMVLYEGFTQASCGPCAQQNPAINALIEANLDKIVPIKHQTSWPGTDPMNLHNPTEVASRVSYYNITGVPGRRLNGKDIAFSQANINAQYNTNAAFTIDITPVMSLTLDTILVSVTVTAQQDITTATFKTRIAVVEKEILFDVAPGTNGEKRFIYVMKKFFPNANGLSMPASMLEGESVTFTDFWVHQNVYNIGELAVVAYVQNDANVPVGDNKNVYQAGIKNVEITLENDLNATLVEAAALSVNFATDEVCDYQISPTVSIRNSGNDNLTSLDFRYRVNDSSYKTYTWNGNIETFKTTTINLPAIAFFHDASGENTLEVELLNANGQTDEDVSDNEFSINFFTAKNSSTHVRFTLSHDQYDDEITWELLNSSNQVLYSGGPYSAGASGTKTADFYLTSGECYEFAIYDSYGDAQLGAATGVTLYDMINEENLLQNFNGYGFEGRFNFGVNASQGSLVPDSSEVYLSIRNTQLLSEFKVFPNPAVNVLNVELNQINNSALKIQLVDVLGRKLSETGAVSGKATFDVSAFNNGIYFVNVISEGRTVATSTFLISR
jgi:hypothetical protein